MSVDKLVDDVEGDVLRDRIFYDIDVERNAQDRKWGVASTRDLPLTVWQTVLTEEVGEVAQAILKGQKRPYGLRFVRTELVQVAATAVAMLEAIDAGHAPFGIKPEEAG